MKKKFFDTVEMMRSIRNKLSKKYYRKTGVLMRDLREIRLKYGLKVPKTPRQEKMPAIHI